MNDKNIAAAPTPPAATAAPSDALLQRHLDLLQDVLDAKQVMLAAGCKQDQFSAMFREYAERYGQAAAASPDFPHYEMAFICRVLEGDHPEKADLDTALGMARSVRVALLKERAAQAPAASADPVAVLRFDRGTPGRENEMPTVVSCNRLPDGEYAVYLAPVAAQAPQHITSATAARDEFPMLYDSLDALDERAAEQPERIGTQRHLSSLRTSIQAVVQKLSLARARISDLESAASAEPVALDRDTLVDLIAVHLSGTYHCTRVWSAWSFGTMSEDDFEDVSESDTPSELADAILARLAAPVADQAPQDERMETTSEHIARDIREGRFPQRSEPQRVQATEWGPMPDAGVEADAHVAVIEGDEAVRVLRWNSDVGAFSYPVGTRLYAAQAPAADGDALREAVKTAYGYLWHVNNEPGTPNQYAPERAAYKARIVLREQLTKDERGEGITVVRAAMQRTTGSEK